MPPLFPFLTLFGLLPTGVSRGPFGFSRLSAGDRKEAKLAKAMFEPYDGCS
jgi:hypothetical protein